MKFKESTHFMFIMLTMLILSLIFNVGSNSMRTSATSDISLTSNVLEDFQDDSKFNIDDYPVDNTNFSLNVIQIAEVERDLIVYVYQPCFQRDFRATSINISTALGDDLSFNNYSLSYLNSSGTLYKYKVNNLIVEYAERRYYEISSIFREWNNYIDKDVDKATENTINEVSFKVAKAYTFSGFGKDKIIFSQDVETIEVVSKYVGSVRRKGGIPPYHEKSCDSHFVAFSTDKKIDALMEAEVYFKYRSVSVNKTLFDVYIGTTYGDFYTKELLITDDDNFVTQPLFNKQFVRQRIESAASFINIEKNSLQNETKEFIAEKEWVLRFFETSYSTQTFSVDKIEHSVEVSEVSLMRLKFETDGKVYNLGVVDNKQTGSNNPDNKETMPFWLKIVLIVGAVLVALILIIAFAPQIIIFVLKLIFTFIMWILKALWWLVCLPFRLFNKD